MNIAITGASGFIGRHLTAFLTEQGHRVVPMGRPMFREGMLGYLVQALSHCDVVINLAGAPINRRWTPEYKHELYDSRIHVTHRIVRALSAVRQKPKLMISASAVGYYPLRGTFDEYTRTRGDGFLSDLCYAWEKEARRCPTQTRLVITRFGVVLSPDGGAMSQMFRPLSMKFAAAIGPGTQPFPWISIDDLCRAMAFFIENNTLQGVFNLVSPQEITQAAFTRAFAKAYRAWGTVIVPRFVFRMMYGEGAAVLTDGQYVRPKRLLEEGFRFTDDTVGQLFRGVDRSTINSLDLSRYMGRWYEIARYDHRFERGMSEVTATYKLRPDGTIGVLNAGYKQDSHGKIRFKRIAGRAKMPDAACPGRLKVSFFLWFYSDYYILELDKEEYNYALIGSSSDKYLWILSRTPQLPEDAKKLLLTSAMRRGYDTNRLLWIDQTRYT
ncbi:TIGR01777 family oxidoreductase [Bacteroides sp.]